MIGRRRHALLRRAALATVALLVTAACGSTEVRTGAVTTATTDGATPSEAETGPTLATGEEIREALTGNTIIGNWAGEDYRQYFDESGETRYLPTGGEVSVGAWRVDIVDDRYESLWGGKIWDVYEVHRDGDAWFWTGGGVELAPFSILEGDQLGR